MARFYARLLRRSLPFSYRFRVLHDASYCRRLYSQLRYCLQAFNSACYHDIDSRQEKFPATRCLSQYVYLCCEICAHTESFTTIRKRGHEMTIYLISITTHAELIYSIDVDCRCHSRQIRARKYELRSIFGHQYLKISLNIYLRSFRCRYAINYSLPRHFPQAWPIEWSKWHMVINRSWRLGLRNADNDRVSFHRWEGIIITTQRRRYARHIHFQISFISRAVDDAATDLRQYLPISARATVTMRQCHAMPIT